MASAVLAGVRMDGVVHHARDVSVLVTFIVVVVVVVIIIIIVITSKIIYLAINYSK